VLVNITGGEDLGIMEVNDAMNFIYEAVGSEIQSNIIFGTVINPDFKDEIAITVIATGFGQVHSPKQFSPKLTGGIDAPKRQPASPAYPPMPKPAPIVEPYKEYDRNTLERYTLPESGLPPERFAAPERFQQPPERYIQPDQRPAERPQPERPAPSYPGFQAAQPAKPTDEPSRVPFAKPIPGKAGFGHLAPPAPRDDENRVLFNDASDPNRNKMGTVQPPSHKGRYKDLDPDIDYETPAFLRNQAD
jgi:hypothetical protein